MKLQLGRGAVHSDKIGSSNGCSQAGGALWGASLSGAALRNSPGEYNRTDGVVMVRLAVFAIASILAATLSFFVTLSLLNGHGVGQTPSLAEGALWHLPIDQKRLKPSRKTAVAAGKAGALVTSEFEGKPHANGRADGALIYLPPDVLEKIAGRRIKIEADITAARFAARNEIAMSYSVIKGPASGWQRFTTKQVRDVYSFTMKIPTNTTRKDRHYISILSSYQGNGSKVTVHALAVRPL